MLDGPALPRVAFNAALLSPTQDYRSAGIHQYIVGLAGAISLRSDCDFRILAANGSARSVLPEGSKIQSIPSSVRRPTPRILWEQLVLPWSLLYKPVDLLHGPAYSTPLGAPVPAVVTVHDMSFFRMPEVLPRAKSLYLRTATAISVRRAAAVIAVSEFTRTELVDILGIAPDRVFVVPNGVSGDYRPYDADSVEGFISREDLPRDYILSVGTLEPRKNLGVLLTAYGELLRRKPDTPELVIAGAPGWGHNDLTNPISALGLDEHVVVMGHVPSEDLPLLYNGASLFAFPSRYEGFGLPVLEAMSCGTPVVASSASSLPEVLGDSGLTVDPDDIPGWATAIEQMLDDADLARRSANDGREIASEFSWERSGELTLEVYRHVLRTHTHNGMGGAAT